MGTPSNPGWMVEQLKELGFEGKSFADLKEHSFVGQEMPQHRSLIYGPIANVRDIATKRSTLPSLRNRP